MRDGISPITVQTWRERSSTAHTKMGSKEVRSTVLKADEEATIVAFRRHTLLPLNDCFYGLRSPSCTCPGRLSIAAFCAIVSAACRR